MDKIPLMPVKQDFLGNMALWCYDLDTQEAVIVFKNDEENICMLDPMWIVNMSTTDIDKLFRHDIFYEDKTPIKLCYFNASLAFATTAEFTLEARGPKQTTRNEDQIPISEAVIVFKNEEFVGAVFASVACSCYVCNCTVFVYHVCNVLLESTKSRYPPILTWYHIVFFMYVEQLLFV
ncbi:hypothetical protein Hanom_Chr13g01186011 [Helianthus anomalus]